ncbi:MAG: hypothetical protein REI12_03585 [Pedobacter sp.]|nr:hypothetical protein [Pedobacter sp.]
MRQMLLVMLLGVLLSGCISMQESTSIREEAVKKGLTVVRALPRNLPDGVSPVPGTQYVLVKADSGVATALSFAVPIPFVTDMAVAAANKREAGQYASHYSVLDPYTIAVERLQGSSLLSPRGDALHLMPVVYVLEGSDGIYRFTQVFRVEGDGWTGRYMYHLPTTYTAAQITNPQPEELENLRKELVVGADILRGLMERDARGELKPNGTKVDIGSYYLVASKALGMVPASAYHYPGNDLVEDTGDHVIVRARGDKNASGNVGGLVFGVHYFLKSQLHTYKVSDAKK